MRAEAMDLSTELAIMNIAGSEWAIIILLALILLVGTKRLPQVSKTIGRAVGEYEKAREMFRREMQEASETARSGNVGGAGASRGNNGGGTGPIPRITGPVATEREKLETIAASLGIEHAGMTDEELRVLISQRMAR